MNLKGQKQDFFFQAMAIIIKYLFKKWLFTLVLLNMGISTFESSIDPFYVLGWFCSSNHSKLFAYWVNVHAFLLSANFFQNQLFEKLFQEYHQSVKQFGSRSGPTFCRA